MYKRPINYEGKEGSGGKPIKRSVDVIYGRPQVDREGREINFVPFRDKYCRHRRHLIWDESRRRRGKGGSSCHIQAEEGEERTRYVYLHVTAPRNPMWRFHDHNNVGETGN